MLEKHNDLKEQFAAITGPRPDFADPATVAREPVSIYWYRHGFITSREIGTTGTSSKDCRYVPDNNYGFTDLLDICGYSGTNGNGVGEFSLRDYFCGASGVQGDVEDDQSRPPLGTTLYYPVFFLATPRSDQPVFLTSKLRVTSDHRNVKVGVFSWKPDGSAAPDVWFNWHCRLPVLQLGTLVAAPELYSRKGGSTSWSSV